MDSETQYTDATSASLCCAVFEDRQQEEDNNMSSEDNISDDSSEQNGKKRKSNELVWKQNIRKQRRNSFEEYESSSGKIVPGKEFQEPVCNDLCFLKITNREGIFERFRNLGTYNKPNFFLSGFVSVSNSSRKLTAEKRVRERSQFKYSLRENGVSFNVCAEAFKSLFQISRKRLAKIQESIKSDDPCILMDRRGKHVKKIIPLEKKEQVRNHIKKFPTMLSHYSRKDSPNKRFLSPTLNLSRMYKMYAEEEDEPVKEWLYRDVFLHEFNYSFGPPRSDSCITCDKLTNKLNDPDLQDTDKATLLNQKESHVRKADLGYAKLKTDIKKSKDKSKSFEVLTFNMQQTLPVPFLSNSQAFYQRQLWVYNECVHVCSNDDSYMVMWSEEQARRGSSEIASALLKVLSDLRKRKILPVKELVLWSDGCSGQNKNFFIVTFWSYLVQRGYADKIRHRFLVSGHTFLPCDRDFSHIEKMKRTHVNEIHVPCDWIKLVEKVRCENPFKVIPMHSEDVFDFTEFASKMFLKPKYSSGLKMRSVTEFCIERENPFSLLFKNSYSEVESYNKLSIHKVGRPCNLPAHVNKYKTPNPINGAKIKDLKAQMDFLPANKKLFWEEFFDRQDKLPTLQLMDDNIDHDEEEDTNSIGKWD